MHSHEAESHLLRPGGHLLLGLDSRIAILLILDPFDLPL